MIRSTPTVTPALKLCNARNGIAPVLSPLKTRVSLTIPYRRVPLLVDPKIGALVDSFNEGGVPGGSLHAERSKSFWPKNAWSNSPTTAFVMGIGLWGSWPDFSSD